MLRLLFYILQIRKELHEIMATVYATLIIEGYKTFDQVPKTQKQKVANILVELGCEELITDPAYLPKTE